MPNKLALTNSKSVKKIEPPKTSKELPKTIINKSKEHKENGLIPSKSMKKIDTPITPSTKSSNKSTLVHKDKSDKTDKPDKHNHNPVVKTSPTKKELPKSKTAKGNLNTTPTIIKSKGSLKISK